MGDQLRSLLAAIAGPTTLHLPAVIVWLIGLVVIGAILILIPYVRRLIAYVQHLIRARQMSSEGQKDAEKFGQSDEEVALDAIKRKLYATKHRVEADFASLKRGWNKRADGYALLAFFARFWPRLAGYIPLYLLWRNEFDDAHKALVAIERETQEPQPRDARWIMRAQRNHGLVLCLITFLDIYMTYLSLQILGLPPIALGVIAFLVGALGALAGEKTGEMLHLKDGPKITGCFVGCLLYCGVLGTMRYAYVLATALADVPPTLNEIMAFGFPFIPVTWAILMGWAHKRPTALERAKVRKAISERWYQIAYHRGERSREILKNRMEELRSRGSGLIDAYQRGFNRAWAGRLLAVPQDVYPVVPDLPPWPPTDPVVVLSAGKPLPDETPSRTAVSIG